MEDRTRTIYVVEGRRWWSFGAEEWIAFFPSALANVRSGKKYRLPADKRVSGPPPCAQRIDGENAWCSCQNDAEIFHLRGWDLATWEEEFAIMQDSGYLERTPQA